jgi:hypothetical protein
MLPAANPAAARVLADLGADTLARSGYEPATSALGGAGLAVPVPV